MSDDTREQDNQPSDPQIRFYRIRFRTQGQEFTASAGIEGLKRDDIAMVKTDHGLEPAVVFGPAPCVSGPDDARKSSFEISRRPTADEENRYQNLPGHESAAFDICRELIAKHSLQMRLIWVEKFFNGSKMIFYFTADSRVDFRGLVKDLVQEFRTRVEMRQVGVRHETKMIGGLGVCGRELCCSSFMKKFDSVSIKMAKEQDLPLNPTKISGVCNRLLCCLTYEYGTYRSQRRKMPKVGRRLKLGDQICRVKRQIPLQQAIIADCGEGEDRLLKIEEWSNAEVLRGDKGGARQDTKRVESDTEHSPEHD